ncbi:MAG TPA: DUF2108 domain-containing protein [Methanoregulaceae archaeon]|nr:MAG: EhaD family protein [Methanolinea sp.]HON82052.1 DUF2108 domain-containing protein [Methanoregulaceae archaeon]HPD10976.1 DUF2108 domain-containing protein [Methanoregulaceae archaeon]HRT15893.1 DUF2108 domain-containing protein [Methanoregulaceae archaeon]HRU31359.1 DUF2108 domain-containing protein [Methanoregulaceae archaeon]
MNEVLAVLYGVLIVLGALATMFSRDPFNKLISLGLLVAGVMPFLSDRGMLDILTATALIAPLSTIFILMALRRNADES